MNFAEGTLKLTIRALIANAANSAQVEGTPYHSPKLHPGPCSSVGMRRGTDRHTDGRG